MTNPQQYQRSQNAKPTMLPTVVEPTMPNNPEAEEAVLGSLLIDRDVIIKVANILKPEDFFSEERAAIYRVICQLYTERTPTDILTLKTALKTAGKLGEGEGQVAVATLFRLMNATPSPTHVEHYAKLVEADSLRRKLINLGAGIVERGYNSKLKAEDALTDATNAIQKITSWRAKQQQDYFMSHEDTFGSVVDDFEVVTISQPQLTGPRLCFGWPGLDGKAPASWATSGFEPTMLIERGTITTVSADSSVGKTIVGEQIAEANAPTGACVLFFHNELLPAAMKLRRYTRLTGIPYSRLKQKERLNDYDRADLLKAAATVKGWAGRIDFVHCPGWDGARVAQEIRARNAIMQATNGRGYDLFVMDYLQRMGESVTLMRAGGNKAERVGHNLLALGDVANELNMAAIVLSQVSRGDGDKSKFVKPELHNNLYCGDIERFSNQVLGVWREENAAQFIGLKSTFGERDWVLPLRFVPEQIKFVEE